MTEKLLDASRCRVDSRLVTIKKFTAVCKRSFGWTSDQTEFVLMSCCTDLFVSSVPFCVQSDDTHECVAQGSKHWNRLSALLSHGKVSVDHFGHKAAHAYVLRPTARAGSLVAQSDISSQSTKVGSFDVPLANASLFTLERILSFQPCHRVGGHQ